MLLYIIDTVSHWNKWIETVLTLARWSGTTRLDAKVELGSYSDEVKPQSRPVESRNLLQKSREDLCA